jgi:hypothetical protein
MWLSAVGDQRDFRRAGNHDNQRGWELHDPLRRKIMLHSRVSAADHDSCAPLDSVISGATDHGEARARECMCAQVDKKQSTLGVFFISA